MQPPKRKHKTSQVHVCNKNTETRKLKFTALVQQNVNMKQVLTCLNLLRSPFWTWANSLVVKSHPTPNSLVVMGFEMGIFTKIDQIVVRAQSCIALMQDSVSCQQADSMAETCCADQVNIRGRGGGVFALLSRRSHLNPPLEKERGSYRMTSPQRGSNIFNFWFFMKHEKQ